MLDDLRAAGGQLVGVTGETQAKADRARSAWGLRFEMLGDPQLVVAKALYERGIMELYVDTDKWTKGDMAGHHRYEQGMIEPGVAIVRADTAATAQTDPNAPMRTWTKLFAWAAVPRAGNAGAATNRIEPATAWRAAMSALAITPTPAPAPSTVPPTAPPPAVLGMRTDQDLSRMRQAFVALMLLAHGNFVRPLGFELPADGVSIEGPAHVRNRILFHAMPKVLAVAAAAMFSARRAPAATLLALAVYGWYYFRVCHPVMLHSWFGEFGRNALPGLVAADRAQGRG